VKDAVHPDAARFSIYRKKQDSFLAEIGSRNSCKMAEAFGVHLLWKGVLGNYGCGRELRSNARLVATPKSAQNSKLVSVTTTINLWDSAAGTAL
jgi:hypothetical protein